MRSKIWPTTFSQKAAIDKHCKVEKLGDRDQFQMTNDVATIQGFVMENPNSQFSEFWKPEHRKTLPESVEALARVVFLAVGSVKVCGCRG